MTTIRWRSSAQDCTYIHIQVLVAKYLCFLSPHARQEEEGDVRVSAVSVARSAAVSGSDGKLVKRRGDADAKPRTRVALATERPLLLRSIGQLYRLYTPGLAGRWLRHGSFALCCCRPAVRLDYTRPTVTRHRQTDHLRRCVSPTSSCAVLQPSAPASGEFSSACIAIQ